MCKPLCVKTAFIQGLPIDRRFRETAKRICARGQSRLQTKKVSMGSRMLRGGGMTSCRPSCKIWVQKGPLWIMGCISGSKVAFAHMSVISGLLDRATSFYRLYANSTICLKSVQKRTYCMTTLDWKSCTVVKRWPWCRACLFIAFFQTICFYERQRGTSVTWNVVHKSFYH